MAIKIVKFDKVLWLEYTVERFGPDRDGRNWMDLHFEVESTLFFKTLYLRREQMETHDEDVRAFAIGDVKNDLIFLRKDVFNLEHDFCFDVNFSFEFKYLAYTAGGMGGAHIGYIEKISKTIKKTIIVSDNTEKYPESIPIKKYIDFIKHFPTAHELKLYANKRIEDQIGAFLDIDDSNLLKYERYLDKKYTKSKTATSTNESLHPLREYELEKYKSILSELKRLLQRRDVSENQWQEKIMAIILLVFPNYIQQLKKVRINTEDGEKEIDLCLVNSNGCLDIVEIKIPFQQGLISEGVYRNNHYPLRELSGSLMQVEKYIYYLNRAGYRFEDEMNLRFKTIMKGIKLKIRNPKGLIIAGDSTNFSPKQKDDFELIRKKSSNIVDIITYDDLIARLENIINFLGQ